MKLSKREEVRAQRQRRKRRQRITTFMIIGGVILVLIALAISPYIINAIRPVGAITSITPIQRPMVNGKTMGDPAAPVVIEVFEDFQCPNCATFSKTTEQSLIDSDYITSGKVYYIFRQYPFLDYSASTKESHQAANASMCALEQGRFWDYHDILYANMNGENQGAFINKRLVAFAQNLGLQMDKFNTCFDQNTYKSEIEQDYNMGINYGINGTPSVFVNGQPLDPGYVPDFASLKQAIDAAVLAKGK